MDDFSLDLDLGLSPRKKLKKPKLAPAEEQSLLGKIGDVTMSGLGYIGDTLDKYTGSRALRGTLGGNPRELLSILPFSDDIGITNSADKTSGKDLLTKKWGWMKDDPDSWMDDIAGFGADVLLDPTNLIGIGELSAAGKALQASGGIDDLIKAGTKGVTGGLFESTLTKSAGDILGDLSKHSDPAMDAIRAGGQSVPDSMQAFRTAAEGAGHNADELLKQKPRSLASIGLPMMDPIFETNFGLSDDMLGTIGKGRDAVHDAIRYSGPGKWAAQLFNPDVGDTATELAQRNYEPAAAGRSARTSAAVTPALEMAQNPTWQGLDEGTKRRMVEGVGYVMPGQNSFYEDLFGQQVPIHKEIPTDLAPHIESLQQMMGALQEGEKKLGRGASNLVDEHVDYFPRLAEIGHNPIDPAQGREGYLRNLPFGTDQINELVKGAPSNLQRPQDLESYFNSKLDSFDPHSEARASGFGDVVSRMTPEQRAQGLFPHDPLYDYMQHVVARTENIADTDATLGILGKAIQNPAAPNPNNAKLLDVLKGAGLTEPETAANKANANVPGGIDAVKPRQETMDQLIKRSGIQNAAQILSTQVDPDVAKDILNVSNKFSSPDGVGKIANFVDQFLTLWKPAMLTWPARYIRDGISGGVATFLTGENPANILSGASISKRLLEGDNAIPETLNFPVVQQILRDQGIINPTAEDGTRAWRSHLASQQFLSGITGDASPTVARGSLKEVTDQLPGSNPFGPSDVLPTLQSAIPRTGAQANPLNIRGSKWQWNLMDPMGAPAREGTENSVVKAGEKIGGYVDSMNRLPLYTAMIMRGVDPAVARARTLAVQVDYSRHAFTPFETNYLKRAAPFYGFLKGATAHLVKELTQNPRGPLSKFIRAESALDRSDDDNFKPESVRNTLSVPIPGAPEGQQRYLTGFGLMHEDPLNLIRPRATSYHTAQDTIQGLIGRTNPLIKAPIEVAAGKQFFSGRDLEDLDPTIGRIYSNAKETLTGEKSQPPEIPILLEQALSNSPLARVATTARQALDPRKDIGTKALSTLTGARVRDVDMEKEKQRAIREALEDLLRGNPGVLSYEHLYSPDDAQLDPGAAELLGLYESVTKPKGKPSAAKKKKSADLFDLDLGL